MQKAASAYKTISEVSEALDIPAHVLRFWESKFSQLKPMKRSGGRRYYRQEDIALLEMIKSLLYDEG
ncbi:MAG: MerR family transcriptional regulator, partial [Candidatus Puniceispirillaceae bacterium]